MSGEFRTFITRGNVIDLAVGIVIGAAFTSVVNSFVNDVLMPPVGLLTGGIDFSNMFINLSGEDYATFAAAQEAGAPTINYGLFLNSIISFLLVGFAVFLFVRSYNRMREQEKAAPPPPSEKQCPFCRLTIPVAATRCAHCTSELAATPPPAGA